MPTVPGRFCYRLAFATALGQALGHCAVAQTVPDPGEAGVLQEIVVTSTVKPSSKRAAGPR